MNTLTRSGPGVLFSRRQPSIVEHTATSRLRSELRSTTTRSLRSQGKREHRSPSVCPAPAHGLCLSEASKSFGSERSTSNDALIVWPPCGAFGGRGRSSRNGALFQKRNNFSEIRTEHQYETPASEQQRETETEITRMAFVVATASESCAYGATDCTGDHRAAEATETLRFTKT
ncbi:unnamed protein product [Trichogramma brassicae]|uniref:Uncharacterized protein n=1 Tax=Trichogramma brassicae TaxID=86971 RepID=A0A6H5I2A7_9HYME|nr:unnamed protein product [Trichogramma brassicae]